MISGFYWVKRTSDSDWEVSYYNQSFEKFYLTGTITPYKRDQLVNVIERELVRPVNTPKLYEKGWYKIKIGDREEIAQHIGSGYWKRVGFDCEFCTKEFLQIGNKIA